MINFRFNIGMKNMKKKKNTVAIKIRAFKN